MSKKILGFIIAPLSGVCSTALIVGLEGIISKLQNPNIYDKPTSEVLVAAIVMYGLPLVYLLAAIVGIPSVWFLKKSQISLYHFLLLD